MKQLLPILICFWSFQVGYGQDLTSEIGHFFNIEFFQGEHTFQLMKSKLIQFKKNQEPLIDDNGKILIPKIDLNLIENESKMEFIPSGSIKLDLNYSDTLLSIKPLENSFYPHVNIDIKSTIAYINESELTVVKKICVENKKNAFNSEWEGFQWQTKLPDQASKNSFKFTVGKLKEDGKIYIEILWFVNGKRIHYRLLS